MSGTCPLAHSLHLLTSSLDVPMTWPFLMGSCLPLLKGEVSYPSWSSAPPPHLAHSTFNALVFFMFPELPKLPPALWPLYFLPVLGMLFFFGGGGRGNTLPLDLHMATAIH